MPVRKGNADDQRSGPQLEVPIAERCHSRAISTQQFESVLNTQDVHMPT